MRVFENIVPINIQEGSKLFGTLYLRLNTQQSMEKEFVG